jgi:hypothetical protein
VDEDNMTSFMMKLNANISAKPSDSILLLKAKFCHEDTEGEHRYNFTLSLTSEVESGGSLEPHPSHFNPENNQVPVVQETGWEPGMVWPGAGKSFPHLDLIPRPSGPSSVAIQTLSQPTFLC